MANVYFDASFAGVTLMITRINTEGGRDVAVQSPELGDKHVLQDKGLKLERAQVEIMFTDQDGKAPYLDRFNQFRKIALGGVADIFSHPILGSYQARISDFSADATPDACVMVSCVILPEDEPVVVMSAGAGVSTQAGLESVSVASGNVTTQLTAIGLTSSVPGDVLDAVTGWVSGDDPDTAQVFAQLATLSAVINAMVDDLELATDINRWQAYRVVILLGYQLARAAEAVTSTADQVFDVTITTARPLIAICAEIYGAAFALDKADQVARLNRVRIPGRIAPGTRLKLPLDGARA